MYFRKISGWRRNWRGERADELLESVDHNPDERGTVVTEVRTKELGVVYLGTRIYFQKEKGF